MTGKFSVTTTDFQGPLEALLDLIEARKLSISQVSLAEVCDAYLAYVEHMPEIPLGETSQFILIASTLLLVKSRSLLPMVDLTSDERETVEELERRLARLAVVRGAAKRLRKVWGVSPLALPQRTPVRPSLFNPGEISAQTLVHAICKMLDTLPKVPGLVEATVAPVIALEDAISRVRERLSTALRTRFSDMTRSSDRNEIIVYFLAMLELVRSGSASVTQDRLFEDILIEIEQLPMPRYGA